MTVIVPVPSPAWFAYNQIATLTALIAATTSGSPARYQYQEQLNQLQRQLVATLIEQDKVPASAILSTMTYGAADTNAI